MDKNLPVTLSLYQRLRAAERAQDRSIRANSDLVTSMLDAHAETGVPYRVGQEAIERAHRAVGRGLEGRRELGRSHASLVPIAKALGFDWRMGGDVGNTQEEFFGPTGSLETSSTDSVEERLPA